MIYHGQGRAKAKAAVDRTGKSDGRKRTVPRHHGTETFLSVAALVREDAAKLRSVGVAPFGFAGIWRAGNKRGKNR